MLCWMSTGKKNKNPHAKSHLLEREPCFYAAQARTKETVKHVQAKQWERHVEQRAHVVYANLGSLNEPLTNELPGVFLIDICS